ncbi:hypothetical protein [Micromonospora peucetia]|uniref:Uncharacterized protein n=1 Tax=Micromonospora peucetia TaxID=47871 RepID=A0A1C6ULS0_9ACTN|nr:hypothetical protein [Micromonospora peucetia]WSA34346.1 hypothetical protein OIE14_10035 [Micromonospora peucetia]SCL54813.1 hypothetical protein GA0070608_1391 [Micromonospora peucetia]
MNGEELREALRGEMSATTPPPPLSTTAMLGTARRARSRRRTVWACAGSAAAVLAVVGVATVNPPGAGGYGPAGPAPQAVPHPSVKDTAQPWPTGPDGRPQEDRTARAGSRYDQGIRLLDEVTSVVPAGYTAPENPANLPADRMPFRTHQAQFEDKVNGVDVWSYMSSAALAQGKRMGRLLVEVHTAGNQLPAEPCPLARQFWGMQGECQVVSAGAAQVGVVVRPARDDRFDQWAAYRHPDGVVVFVAQGASLDDERQGLATLPFSVRQLAALAVNERFHLR